MREFAVVMPRPRLLQPLRAVLFTMPFAEPAGAALLIAGLAGFRWIAKDEAQPEHVLRRGENPVRSGTFSRIADLMLLFFWRGNSVIYYEFHSHYNQVL
jgi:hypothetical protein